MRQVFIFDLLMHNSLQKSCLIFLSFQEPRPKKKRKRIKKTSSGDEDENEDNDDENESPSKKGGRKDIRKILKDKKLSKETKTAAEEEKVCFKHHTI